MVKLDKYERTRILEYIRMERERRQQALNRKRAQLRILPQEIEAIEKEIEKMDVAITWFEKQRVSSNSER